MNRHSTHSAKPDTLVCTLPEPWLYRAGRRGDAITDLRFIEARLRTNPSLLHLELPIAAIMDHPNGLKALATRFGHLHRIRSYAASGRLSPAADIHAAFSNLQPFRSDCRHLLR